MWLIIDQEDSLPLTRQIYHKIKDQILNGSLVSREKLPSTRALANQLRISRNTVLDAYNQLIAEGYLEGVPGSGTMVSSGLNNLKGFLSPMSIPPQLSTDFSDYLFINFRSGIPDLAYFPRKEWAKLYQQVCYDLPAHALRYYPPDGVPQLRNAISQYLFRTRGISCAPKNIMIVSGSTQGLSLVSRLLYKEHLKDSVLIEDPIHPGLLQTVAAIGYQIIGVPVDEKGMQPTQLPPPQNVSFLYTTPSHQYPLGGILPIQRRLALLAYAKEAQCYIVEDDYDSEFRYEGPPVSSLYELNPDKVIYIGSFSKILSPALRLGYVLLPDHLLSEFKTLKLYSDVHTEAISQYVLAEFIQTQGLENHIRKMKKIYIQKRNHLLKELSKQFPGKFQVKGHAAGLHILVHFDDIVFTKQLVADIYSNGVKIYPVENYSVQQVGRYHNDILLGYAHLSLEQITDGIRILSEVIKNRRL